MMTIRSFGIALVVVLGLMLNLAFQVSSQHLSCDENEDLPNPPECSPLDEPGNHSTYFPVPYDCRKYFQCSNGIGKCFRCAPGTIWNQTLETCVHNDGTECRIRHTTPTSSPPSTTTPITTTTERPWDLCPIDDPMPLPDCPAWEFAPPLHFPYPYDCRKYFVCVNRVAVCMNCPNRTVWNQDLWVCDRESSISCVIVTTTPNPAPVRVWEDGNEVGIVSFFQKLPV